MEKRATQKEVAKKAGVHSSTVSLAFKNHHSIPEATRQRIKQAAAEVGYFPDPMLAALAAYRGKNRPSGFRGTLAWLTNNLDGFRWQANLDFTKYCEGARLHAESCGFRLREFDLQEPGMTPKRLRSILHSQSIQGILLCPQPHPNMEIDFPWDEFSLVTFGHTLLSPKLHRVACAHYEEMRSLMQHLWDLGYRRVGFCIPKEHVRRVSHNFLAGYFVGANIDHRFAMIPPFDQMKSSLEEFRQWFNDYRCDAIICAEYHILKPLAKLGFRVPEDLGVVNFLIFSPDGPMAGIYQDSRHMGEVAADVLIRLVQRGEKGVPAIPQNIFIEGKWIPGETVRAQNGEARAGSAACQAER